MSLNGLRKIIIATVYLLSLPIYTNAFNQCNFEHYSDKDGLSQSTINEIFQDHKGYIWLGTFNGLIRYNGYDFETFKLSNSNSTAKSNRIDKITEDKYGRLWLNSLNDVYCFDTSRDKYWSLPSENNSDINEVYSTKVFTTPSGKVWLILNNKNLICIKDSNFSIEKFESNNKLMKSKNIYSVHEDANHNSWILTNNGLLLIPANSDSEIQSILNNTTDKTALNKPFFTLYESPQKIWFGSSKGKIWTYDKDSRIFSELNLNIKSNIREIKRIDESHIAILSESDGMFIYNTNTSYIKYINKFNTKGLNNNQIDFIYPVDSTQIWFTNNEIGIYKINLSTNQLKHFNVDIDDRTVYNHPPQPFILKDKDNNIWIHPKGGGFSIYNKNTDSLEAFYNKAFDPNKKFSNILHTALFDHQGNLWMSTRSHGLEKISFSNNEFKSFRVTDILSSSLSNNVRSIFQLANQNILIGTKEGRLLMFNSNLEYITAISDKGINSDNTLWPSAIYCIKEDDEGKIWIGTRGNGIYVLKPNKDSISYKVQNFVHDRTNPFSISNNNVYSIVEDANKNIWCATLGGGINLIQYNQEGKYRFINSLNKLKNFPAINCNRVRCMAIGKNNVLYAGTSNGLLTWKADFNSPESIIFNHYTSNSFNTKNLSNNEIMGILLSKNKEIFIATYGGGLNKLKRAPKGNINGFQSYNNENILASDGLLSLVDDKHGNIWMSTENNLIRFNPDNELFENFHEVGQKTFSESTSLRLNNNSLLFGFSNGLISFYPDSVLSDTLKSNIVFTNFQLFNKNVRHTEDSPLLGNIDDIKRIELRHNQNFFNIQFSTLDYQNTKQIEYAYKLEGFDKEWYYTQKQRIANYTNIPKGTYIFKVKSTNGRGTWMNNEHTLNITVKPSFWETPLAYILYFSLFLFLFFILQKYILTIYRLKSDIKVQKEISDMKLKFFTDVSHEIRTPLTMITSPIEFLINDKKTPQDIRNQLKFISQGTNRLLKLVNQILDFRKIQDKHLKVSKINLGHFTEKICLDFMELAEEKGFDFSFKDISGNIDLWADQDALDKIIMNLLSNAFKYCSKGDSIKVVVQQTDKYAILKITDSGPGISKTKQKDLFKRFSSFNDDSSKPSTGIGLSIIKEIAEKHSALVSVESETGKGSSFTISFLNGKNHYDDNVEIIVDNTEKEDEVKLSQAKLESDAYSQKQNTPKEKYSILIVEDDNELRQFIKTILEQDYAVIESDNGMDGLEKAKSQSPDFIISDIMMPEKNGIELLKDIRKNTATSHIPVILLTAKSNIESKLEGLTYGADDYITKPFSVAYMKARITNLIKQREHLHNIFRDHIKINEENTEVKQNLIAPADELLMQKVMNHIEKNLDNNELSVENLAKSVGLSRSTFFNKIKSLTGMPPVEFIRDLRLSKAAHLIKTEQFLIKEICYMTGFSDLKYFGKCFKNKYGMTPGNYRKSS